ncbi:PNGase F N-terminal domain-containing protein [Algibacter sp. L4_22]|uniref:PNGase F N-terminal domain-containing protein n=1 Tax=Algibacter sp. L4_22 TaxID=2942477 RepID=UPI00201B8E61|nr:PNGase F N-terminal domain-containing protein [Algibacter sp. L4_22]MCL5129178.1 N-glycanase [Algibacter sp. L4_22]
MKVRSIVLFILLISVSISFSQNKIEKVIFKDQIINYGKTTVDDPEIIRLQGGRVILKKVTVPKFKKGTDVNIKLSLRSNGDKWDKSGSCFVITNPDDISFLNIAEAKAEFPKDSYVNEKHGGVKATENYKPVVELLRFMTPFGVGHYSNDKVKHRKPVYVPKWEKEVVWNEDISDLESIVSDTFYVGVWIDTWTKVGYKIDLSLSYSGRPKTQRNVIPLINVVSYVKGQALPYFFAEGPLEYTFNLDKNIKNAKLHYITTGHGGHSGGDEFIKIKNSVLFNEKTVIDTIPWRDDCASFRRFNPTSGVWLRKDSTYYRDRKAKTYKIKEIEERLASSDLSRSNWCPGSKVTPYVAELGDLKLGEQNLTISIPATKAEKDKTNHWLVSAYITYER